MWLYIGLLLLVTVVTKTKSEIECKQNNDCVCYNAENDVEYQCPINTPKVVVRVFKDPAKVIIDCYDTSSYLEEDTLPRINLGAADKVSIRFCGLPRTNYISIFRKLNITQTRTLTLDGIISEDGSSTEINSNLLNGFEFLEYLTLTNNNNITIVDNFLERIPKLKELNLYSNNIYNIDNLNLSVVPKLTFLDMSKTNMQSISAYKFKNLKNLRQVYLFNNKITTLDPNTFKGAENIEMIELSRNKISFIHNETFKDLKKLYNISFLNNNLTSITKDTFQNHEHLFLVRLGYNPNLRLFDYALSYLTNLTILRLDNCNLKELPDNLFEGSLQLKDIQLDHNQLDIIPENLFGNLRNLSVLNLGYNKLESFPSAMFESLISLKDLNLEHNSLTRIEMNTFKNQKRLQVLNLRFNQILSIDIMAFRNLEKVKTIDLSHNKFNFYKSEFDMNLFSNTIELVSLNLSHNMINTVYADDYLSKSVYLRSVDVSYNEIKGLSLQNIQSGILSETAKIDFSHNNITTIDSFLINYSDEKSNLQVKISLNIANNPIKCDCYNFPFVRDYPEFSNVNTEFYIEDYENIKCIDFNWTITDVKKRLEDMNCPLEKVFHSEYSCPDNCECFWKPYNFTFEVDCSNRIKTQIPKFLTPTLVRIWNGTYGPKNVVVNLENNVLDIAPTEEDGYENVTELLLSHNNIHNISWIPPNIRVLHLDNNKISSLQDEFVEFLNKSSLRNLTLDGNPWICDCSTVKLQSYLLNKILQVDANNVRCKNTGKQIIQNRNICRSDTVVVLSISVTVVIVLLIIVCAIASYYKWQEEVKVWLYNKNLCLWFVTEEDLDKDKEYDVFLSFSHKDDEFALKTLLPALESEPNPFKVCVHYRNWIPGEHISTQVVNSVKDSRRTVIVLSNNFIESCWAIMEFRTAHTQAISEKRSRVILIIYGDLDMSKLSDEMKAYLRTNTYVKWGDPWFWQKLSYALPHSKHQKERFSQKHANVMLKIDKKFELGASFPAVPQSTPPILSLDAKLLSSYPFVSEKIRETQPTESGSPLIIDKLKKDLT